MLTNEQWDALVRRVEAYARESPRAYGVKVAALAVVGYAYVWLVLLISLGLLIFLIWYAVTSGVNAGIGKLVIVIGVFAYAVAQALWIRFEPPVGIPLTRDDAPAMFNLLDELQRALHTPSFHRVLLTNDFNAGITQLPRLGPLGWYANYLELGLPLMQAMSPEEFKAIVAHELGHISGEHGRFSAWIYRIRVAWGRLVEQLESRRRRGFQIFGWFLRLWAPYFNAYSFVMAREQEYEADRYSAQLAGKDNAARALVASEIQGARLYQRFWPRVYQTTATEPEPPVGILASLREELHRPPGPEDGRRWLTAALNRATGTGDTHPSLSARLHALGVSAPDGSLRGAPDRTAADQLLGERLPQLTRSVETMWRQATMEGWLRKHRSDKQSGARLKELEDRAATEPLPVREAWERAELELQLHGPDSAVVPLGLVLALDADHAAANYTLGEILLDRHDEKGVALIERAVARDSSASAQGYQRIWAFYEEAGRTREAAEYRKRAWAHGDLHELAADERREVSGSDSFLPHELSEPELNQIREALGRYDSIAEAYFVRKAVSHMPEVPLYVLGVKMRLPWYRYRSTTKEQELVADLAQQIPVPGQWFVIALNDHTAKIHRKLKRIPGARLVGR